MFARAAKVAVIVMLMGSIGFHWALLQSVAWAGMVVSYTKETSSLTTALERTFDGKHPCKICIVVEQGKKTEKKADQLPTIQKLELFSESAPASPAPLLLELDLRPVLHLSGPARSSPPPFLPPRIA